MIAIKRITQLLLLLMLFNACDKRNDKPGLPSVTTTALTNVTATGATTGGTINSDGGSAILAAGVAYSKSNPQPVITDDTVKANVTTGSFVSELRDLDPSATYYVRAFAMSAVGVGYGEVQQLSTGNGAPEAQNVVIEGNANVGSLLRASYTYFDFENDAESGTTFQWYRADDASGNGEAAIEGATDTAYIVTDEDSLKFIRVSVTPKSSAGTLTGVEVKSAYTTGVGDQVEVTFLYNGQFVSYGIINSSVTGRKWLDRSLGAAGTPTSLEDWQNWGDVFQWGRGADGHQVVTRTGPDFTTDITGVAEIGTGQNPQYSSTDVPAHSLFIRTSSSGSAFPFDWRKPQNDSLWQGVNGINNPCPEGWRIPTIAEWQAENLVTPEQAYTQLNLTYNHSRVNGAQTGFLGGVISSNAKWGYYWSSTALIYPPDRYSDGIYLNAFNNNVKLFSEQFDQMSTWMRGEAAECRCIKD